jgi:hypothetical protein
MTQHCEVYFRGDTVFVNSLAKTASFGFLMRSGPTFKVGRGEPPGAWGEAVLKALSSYREGAADPEPPGAVSPEFLTYLGVKSWNTFARGALHLGVEFDGREVSLTPSARNRGAFEYLPAEQAVKSPPEPQAVGAAMLAALERCS